MDPESAKPSPCLNRFVSSISWLLPASILNNFNQSSNTDHDELGVTDSIPSYPPLPSSISERFDSSSSSSSEKFHREDSNGAESSPPSLTPSMASPPPFYYQMQTTEPTDLEHLPAGDSASSSESSPRDGIKVSPPQPSTIATQQSPNSKISTRVEKLPTNEVRVLISNTEEKKADAAHPVLEIIDEQELGRNVLVLAIPMVMGLVLSSNPLAKSLEMKVVAVELCCAFAAIWNGILLRKSHRTASTLLLVGGIALMMLAFYSFVGCFLPIGLKWIPGLCWLGSLFPLAKVLFALFGREKVAGEENDLEMGKD